MSSNELDAGGAQWASCSSREVDSGVFDFGFVLNNHAHALLVHETGTSSAHYDHNKLMRTKSYALWREGVVIREDALGALLPQILGAVLLLLLLLRIVRRVAAQPRGRRGVHGARVWSERLKRAASSWASPASAKCRAGWLFVCKKRPVVTHPDTSKRRAIQQHSFSQSNASIASKSSILGLVLTKIDSLIHLANGYIGFGRWRDLSPFRFLHNDASYTPTTCSRARNSAPRDVFLTRIGRVPPRSHFD